MNLHLNAVVSPLFEQARSQAEIADEALRNDETLGPLHGVPVTIKESIKVAGTATTLGLPGQMGWRAETDGPLVTRLRRGGAILLGKTNISQLTLYPEADNPVYGRTTNPWNPARTCGGSSGGEAAIIASGGSALGIGNDSGGSVRIPAHFCGIHGLNPTAGRLTNEDTRLDLFPSFGPFIPQQGPLARRVQDLALAMSVLSPTSADCRPDEAQRHWPSSEIIESAELGIEGFYVGYYEDNGYTRASPAIRRAVREAAEILRARGASVAPFTPPDVGESMRLFLSIMTADGALMFKRALGDNSPDPRVKDLLTAAGLPRALRPLIAKVMELRGQHYTASMVRWMGRRSKQEYSKLLQELDEYRQRFLAEMDEDHVDLLLSPPYALPAFQHGASKRLFPALSYSLLYNVLGYPAGVVAATRVRDGEESDRPLSKDSYEIAATEAEQGSAGLPVGVQVAARPWREDIVLAAMSALEKEYEKRPDYPLRLRARGSTGWNSPGVARDQVRPRVIEFLRR